MRVDIHEIFELLGLSAVVVLAMIVLMGLCSCTRTIYEPVEKVHTEYRDNIVERVVVDSVTDTRVIYIKGDTVIDYRDRVKWRDREVRDTTLVVRTDSIPVPYPVERKLSRWERTKIDYGGTAIGACLGVICFIVIWLIRKFRKPIFSLARRFI